ncbi:MAG TPA: hypothetical protein VMR46_00760 [Candidatus Paceibacterota bacterium]|nr:hypothetical protein [Candidatus Paceibacterota bacterium]
MRYHTEELAFPNGWEVKAVPGSAEGAEKFYVQAKVVTNFGEGQETDCYLLDDGVWHMEAGDGYGHHFSSKAEAEAALAFEFKERD